MFKQLTVPHKPNKEFHCLIQAPFSLGFKFKDNSKKQIDWDDFLLKVASISKEDQNNR